VSEKILIIEDEKSIVDILKYNLEKNGFETMEAYDGQDGLEKALTGQADLILLDLMLPKMDGFQVCEKLRKIDGQTPVIILTAREEENDKVFGLELGADDYITKPFSMRELMARIKANMRKHNRLPKEETAKSNVLTAGDLRIDLDSCDVYKADTLLSLTAKEFDLLKFFVMQPEKAFSREELLERVWNYGYFGDMRTVDVTVRRLREKIEDNPAQPNYIVTRRGIGYMFKSQEEIK